MIVESINTDSIHYYTFSCKRTDNSLPKYYRIKLERLAIELGVNKISYCYEVEALKEFQDFPCAKLIKISELCISYTAQDKFTYKLSENAVVSEIVFDGFTSVPVGFYKNGGGFSDPVVGKSFTSGIHAFLNEKQPLKKLCVSKKKETSLCKDFHNKLEMTINIKDFQKLRNFALEGKLTGQRQSKESIASFFDYKFPKESKYNPAPNAADLKKMFLTTLDSSLLQKFTEKELEKVESFFHDLMDKNAKNKDFLISNLEIIQELSLDTVINTFEKQMEKNTLEKTWQKFFESNIEIFDSRYVGFVPQFNLKCGRNTLPDFLVFDIYGKVDIYEIKTPTTTLLRYDKSHANYYWSDDMASAISQLEKYIAIAHENRSGIENALWKEKKVEAKIIKPKGVLVIGSHAQLNEDNTEDFEILRASLKNIDIILYDEILASLKNLRDKNKEKRNKGETVKEEKDK